jgi:hypothetical protein
MEAWETKDLHEGKTLQDKWETIAGIFGSRRTSTTAAVKP